MGLSHKVWSHWASTLTKSDTIQQKLPIPFYLARFPRLFPELLKSGQAGQRSQEVMEVSRQRGNNVCNCAGGGQDRSVFLFLLIPHRAKNGPRSVARDPRYAVVSCSPTDNKSSP